MAVRSFTNLYRARTGVAWTSGAIALAPAASTYAAADYIVTDFSVAYDGWDVNVGGNWIGGALITPLPGSQGSALINNITSFTADNVNVYIDYYYSPYVDFYCDWGGTFSDGTGEFYVTYNDGGYNDTLTGHTVYWSWVYCFIEGTKISTPRGLVPIEMLKDGDAIFSYDEKTHLIVPTTVKKAIVHEARNNTLIKVNNRIVATWHHPFLLTNGEWVKVKDLKIGDQLVDIKNIPTPVTSIEWFKDKCKVYNLSVVEEHKNYIANGLVVHNKCPFLYGVNEDGSEELLNTFIYMQDSKDKDLVQKRDTPAKKIYSSYLIKEIDDETSYIEFICLLVTDITGRIHMLRCKNPKLHDIDGQYVCTEVGDVVPIDFRKYTGDEIVSVEILAKGYYIPN